MMPKARLTSLAALCFWLAGAQAGFAQPVQADKAPSANQTPQLVVSDVKISSSGKTTVLTLKASQSPLINVFLLADPLRVIIDMPDAEFRLGKPMAMTGLVKAYRYGHFAPGQSRMVFDIREPAIISSVNVASTVEGAPFNVVIELTKATREEFNNELKKRSAAIRDPARLKESDKPKIIGEASLPLVVLDPGHGGVDGGANGAGGFFEKQFTLSFVKTLQDQLVATGAVRVLLTRDRDVFIPLRQRREIAQSHKAALFMSVHADSFGRGGGDAVRGATVYTLSEKASDQASAAYAERENSADEVAGIETGSDNTDVSDILFDLMQRETKSFSVSFSHHLTGSLKGEVQLNSNPRRAAGFVVLKSPDVPSVLLEMGYLSNSNDLKLMQTEEWQKSASLAITKAVVAFMEQSQAQPAEATGTAAPSTPKPQSLPSETRR